MERADSLLFVAYARHGSFRSMTGNQTGDVAGRLLKHLGSPGWPRNGQVGVCYVARRWPCDEFPVRKLTMPSRRLGHGTRNSDSPQNSTEKSDIHDNIGLDPEVLLLPG
jgi:hypothetical protein